MTAIPGYILKDTIKQTGVLSVFRGIREKEQSNVIIKTTASEHPQPLEIARLKHEYEITQSLKGQFGIIESYELAPYDHQIALIMEDVEGISLSRLIRARTLDITTGLRIAINIAKCLQAIHSAHVIHKDIQPQNIIIQPDKKAIKIIDFGLSTRLERERISVKPPELMEGTLAYISPEQTGRMSREITYRSDFYSLGVVLYEIFTGQLPFNSSNPLELIHFHIAKDPIPPHEINQKIPLMLSKLILKLLEKDGENRYKSASGLFFDLENCLQQLQQKGIIETFSLCTKDQYEYLYIPEKLYGRREQIQTLYKTFEKTVEGKCRLVLVRGPAGIGKSVLIQEVQKPLSQVAGFFITGKFEQFKRNIFRTAIIEAFEQLVRQILSEPENTVAEWKNKILKSLGANGQAIIDVIPDLEAVIGKQKPLPHLPPRETRERFDAAFLAFIRTFISKNHPLILFLDDLQWIDFGSIKLLKSLMRDPQINHLLILGAYRQNEVPSNHPLSLAIEEIDKITGRVVNIDLPPLEQRHIAELLSDTFYQSTPRLKEFAHIIKEKTEGNPYFVKEIMKTLYINKQVNFDGQSKQWEWSVDSLRLIEATNNVVELLSLSISKTSEEAQQVLKIAAALGNIFNLNTLAEVVAKEEPEVVKLLRIPVEKGMIIPIGDTYEFFSEYDETVKSFYRYENVNLSFKFAHDRVQQTAYDLMSDKEKQTVHYEVGKRLLAATGKEDLEEELFTIVYHLNHASDPAADPKETLTYAQLNLQASEKAKNASSFYPALTFALQGLKWLTAEQKESEYDLWYALSVELAECYYHIGEIDRSHQIYQETLPKAKTMEDKVKILIRCNDLYQMKHQYELAINKASEALEWFGYKLPKKITPFVLWKELLRLRWFLYRYPPEAIENLPPMTDSRMLMVSGLLAAMVIPAKIANLPLFFVVCIRLLMLTAHGISPYTVVGLAVVSVMSPWLLKNYDLSFDLATLAIKLADQHAYRTIEHFPLYTFSAFVADRKHTLEQCNHMLMEAYEKGVAAGDLIFSGYALFMVCWIGIFSGESINQLLQKTERAYSFNKRYHKAFPTEFSIVLRRYFLALQGKSKGPHTLSDEQFDTEKLWNHYLESGDFYLNVAIGICQANLCFLHEDYQQAKSWLEKGKNHLISRVNFQVWVHTHYLECLILAALYPNQTPKEQKKSLKTMRKNLKLLKEWSERYPVNKRHYYPLAKAEYERLLQSKENILDLYLEAIDKARTDHFIHDEAIANELAGKYQLEKGRKEIAETFLLEALWGYHQWGARVKVQLLKTNYPSMLHHPELSRKNGKKTSDIDLMEVIKISRKIPRKLVVDQIIDHLMKNTVPATAADKAFLLLSKQGRLVVMGEWDNRSQRAILLRSLPLDEKSGSLCLKAVSYVEKVKEPLVLPSVCQEGLFVNDPYIVKNQVQSILCLPLIHKGRLIGILYLENAEKNNAFTQNRVEMLQLLSPEFAIAIDNASLFAHLKQTMEELGNYQNALEKKVEERSIELTTKNEELERVVEKLHHVQKQMVQQEKLSALGLFNQGVAQEIQDPLNAVNHFSEVVIDQLKETVEEIKKQRTDLDVKVLAHSIGKVCDMTKEINENGAKIKKIVDLMLEHGQMRKGKLALVNVNDLLHESSEIAHENFLSKNEAFTVNIEEHFDQTIPKIEAFPQDLFRVFFNIIQNALYFSNEKKTTTDGRFVPAVTLTTKQEKGFVDILIRDNGSGIPEEIIDHVSTQFFTTKPLGIGTGLGLSLSRDLIVHEHGGQLAIHSSTDNENSFTEIRIKLPTRSPK